MLTTIKNMPPSRCYCAVRAAREQRRQPREAPPTQSLIFEGPGGRTPLLSWTLRTDPNNRGLQAAGSAAASAARR